MLQQVSEGEYVQTLDSTESLSLSQTFQALTGRTLFMHNESSDCPANHSISRRNAEASFQTNLQSEHVMAAEWEKATQLEELDLTATDLSKECLLDILPRIPSIRWLSAGQLDGMTDSVMKVSQRHG